MAEPFLAAAVLWRLRGLARRIPAPRIASLGTVVALGLSSGLVLAMAAAQRELVPDAVGRVASMAGAVLLLVATPMSAVFLALVLRTLVKARRAAECRSVEPAAAHPGGTTADFH